MTKDEALKLALEAAREFIKAAPHGDNCFLHDDGEYNRCFCGKDSLENIIDEALAQPEQEPVAWPVGWVDDGGTVFWKDKPPADGADLYTVIDKSAAIRIATALGWEPKRKPLTDEQWQVMSDTLGCLITRTQKDAIEAVIGIKE